MMPSGQRVGMVSPWFESHKNTLIFQAIAEWQKITHMLPRSSINPKLSTFQSHFFPAVSTNWKGVKLTLHTYPKPGGLRGGWW